ncbi:PAS domain S-box protein [Roseomonas sp. HJA6]|uniref:histidine kinase n=1 Tax=Roseomonas alba TaxID=2846776 RepID=A0ABS7ACL5_9PROT|nr:ATP-binding protein [Neoroseomonas alba]MBW6400036.1 PAS domain S-box protein [Neoroseomonas alba]
MIATARPIIRRFLLLLACGGTATLLLLAGLGTYAYRTAREDALEQARASAEAGRAALEQVVQIVDLQVRLLRNAFLMALAGRPDAAEPGSLGPQTDPGPTRGVTLSLPTAPHNPQARRRMAAAQALYPLQRVLREVMPELRWTYVFDAGRDFVSVYPWLDPPTILGEAEMEAAQRAFLGWWEYDVALGALPQRNPDRTGYWTPVYVDAGGAGLMVSHAVPVDADGQFQALTGADLLVSSLSDMLARRTGGGRFVVIDQKDMAVADAEGRIAGEMRAAQSLLGGPPPVPEAGWVRAGPAWMIALPVAGTPWVLVHSLDAAAVRRQALADVVPYLILAGVVLAGLGLLFFAMLQQFLRPAAGLADYAKRLADSPEPVPPPTVPAPWRPWFTRLEAAVREQRAMTLQRQLAETLKAAVVDVALDAVIIADGEGRVVAFNPGAERIFGYRSDDAIGRRIGELIVPPETRAAHESGMERFRRTRAATVLGRRLELEAMRADGSRFPVELAIHHVSVAGQDSFAAYARDLTPQQEAAREIETQQARIHQIEKLSAMGSLLAGVAHELNNPLAILVAQSTLLREKAGTPDLQRRAERIHAAAERAGRIVKSFLAMARQKPPERVPASLNEAVRAAAEMTAYGARSSGIAVTMALDPALPLAELDRDMMGQVVANLLINAQQALAEQPEPRCITVTTRSIEEDGARWVALEVADNGPGVPAAVAARIFDPYFTTKPSGAGTGIGLSICRTVVEAHGGSIALLQAAGGGACFRVRLRAIDGEAEAAPPAPPRASGLSFLLVDDEPDLAASLAEMLQGLGHDAVIAPSPGVALELAQEGDYDGVIADLRMPGLDGAALRRALVAIDPGWAARVVIMTGDTVQGPVAIARGGEAEGAVVLEKPFGPAELREAIAPIVEARRR